MTRLFPALALLAAWAAASGPARADTLERTRESGVFKIGVRKAGTLLRALYILQAIPER